MSEGQSGGVNISGSVGHVGGDIVGRDMGAPGPAGAALVAAAHGAPVQTDPTTRQWLQSRWLVDEAGRLTIPVLGRFISEAEITAETRA